MHPSAWHAIVRNGLPVSMVRQCVEAPSWSHQSCSVPLPALCPGPCLWLLVFVPRCPPQFPRPCLLQACSWRALAVQGGRSPTSTWWSKSQGRARTLSAQYTPRWSRGRSSSPHHHHHHYTLPTATSLPAHRTNKVYHPQPQAAPPPHPPRLPQFPKHATPTHTHPRFFLPLPGTCAV